MTLLHKSRQTSSNATSNSSLLSKSAEGATLLIGLQFGSRALTFAVNQLLLRYLSPERLGIATQLDVYSISVLFFARESLRVAVQRQTDIAEDVTVPDSKRKGTVSNGYLDARTAAGKTQAVVNIAHLSIPLGISFALLLAWLYVGGLRVGDPTVLQTPYFRQSLVLYGLAAFWELLAEPCFVIVQQKSRYKIRAAAETIATLSRCLVTCLSALWAVRRGQDIGVLPLALGQGVYGISLSLIYYYNVWSISTEDGFSLLPRKLSTDDASAFVLSFLSRPLLVLSISIFAQSIVKHTLTQGDTLLIASLASQSAQGVYAMANNYGGLVARLLLQPVEESSRNYFSKLLSSVHGNPPKPLVKEANKSLHMLLHSYILFSIVELTIGPTIAPLLFGIIAGPRWINSGAGQVLATYCYHIPFLAINGVTEAFVSSVASKTEINRYSMWMLAFSVGFGGAAFIFLRVLDLGANGLVWANTLNMAFRITWSIGFITSYLKRHGASPDLRSLLPRGLGVAASIGTYAILARMNSEPIGDFPSTIITGGMISLVFMLTFLFSERRYLRECYQLARGPLQKVE